METIIISKTQKIIIEEDRIIYFRSDVISEEFKEQHYLFDDLRKVVYVPMRIHWFSTLFLLGFGLISGGGDGIALEKGAINVFFKNKTSRIIDCGEQNAKARKNIVNAINQALKIWRRQTK